MNYNINCPTCMGKQALEQTAQKVLNEWEYAFWLSVKDNPLNDLSMKQARKRDSVLNKIKLQQKLEDLREQVLAVAEQIDRANGKSKPSYDDIPF